MVKICVFFAVRTEFLNITWTSFGFKGHSDWKISERRQSMHCVNNLHWLHIQSEVWNVFLSYSEVNNNLNICKRTFIPKKPD
jgi:hypothetical protein